MWRVVCLLIVLFSAPGVGRGAAPQVAGVDIDPEAELIVALSDDTNNMDPRIGMGSIRSNYIRQVFESLVDVDKQGKPVPGLAWGDSSCRLCRAVISRLFKPGCACLR
jgi:ABC-type oligopeptide transport system substrate-binding subunit